MAKVEIYTKITCGFCVRAKRLLEMKKVPFSEISVDFGGAKKAEMVERAGGQCLQVLVAARQAWARDARQISLSAVSDAFLNSLRQMGLGVDHLTTQEQIQ